MAPLLRIFSLLILLVAPLLGSIPERVARHKIGVCILAMGCHDASAQSLVESARRHLCLSHDVKYFVITDAAIVQEAPDIVKLYHSPIDTKLRIFHLLEEHQKVLEEFDYLFALDSEMMFVAPVGDELLSDLVATQHPAFINRKGAYENNRLSTAYVAPYEGRHYFTSRFFGGKKSEFFKLLKSVKKMIDADLSKDFVSKRQEESHLNRYWIDHQPTRILSPSYCYPENWHLEFPRKVVALSKCA